MPIDPSQQLDPNACRYSLAMDSCVGDAGPSPTEVTNISQPGGKSGSVPNELVINGASSPYQGKSGSSKAQSSDVRGSYNTGYDGP